MSGRSFRSVFMVASCAGAALGCYLVSLNVASERASLEDVENRIVLAQRDIRLLQTEIGTRGRLAQLEKWNVKVLALSAPAANQFLDGGFQLATLVAPKKVIDPAAPVVLASAPAPAPKPVLSDDGASAPVPVVSGTPGELMHVASLKREIPAPEARSARASAPMVDKPATAKPKAQASAASAAKVDKLASAAPVKAKEAAKGNVKPTDKQAKPTKAVVDTKPVKTAASKAPSAKPAAVTKTAAAKPAPAKTTPKAKQDKAAR
jgi:hypothetical protein